MPESARMTAPACRAFPTSVPPCPGSSPGGGHSRRRSSKGLSDTQPSACSSANSCSWQRGPKAAPVLSVSNRQPTRPACTQVARLAGQLSQSHRSRCARKSRSSAVGSAGSHCISTNTGCSLRIGGGGHKLWSPSTACGQRDCDSPRWTLPPHQHCDVLIYFPTAWESHPMLCCRLSKIRGTAMTSINHRPSASLTSRPGWARCPAAAHQDNSGTYKHAAAPSAQQQGHTWPGHRSHCILAIVLGVDSSPSVGALVQSWLSLVPWPKPLPSPYRAALATADGWVDHGSAEPHEGEGSRCVP